MFSLLAGLWHYLFTRPNLHILIIGLDHAGKTTLLERIKTQFGSTPGLPPEKIPPTVGMNLAKIHYRGVQVIFWDLGGQVKMRSIWEKYYLEANAVVYVVDSADPLRLEEAKLAYDATCDHDELAAVPIITFANKQDLPGAISPGDLAVSFYHTGGEPNTTSTTTRNNNNNNNNNSNSNHTIIDHTLPVDHHDQEYDQDQMKVFSISAVTGHGIEEALAAVIDLAKRNRRASSSH